MRAYLAAALLLALLAPLSAKLVTIRNDVPRLDMNGDIIDCHSGNIVYYDGLYVIVGEMYKNYSGLHCGKANETACLFPKIVTYSSPDLQAWTFRGEALDGKYPNAPFGTHFTPWILPPNERNSNWTLWHNAYPNGCCTGEFWTSTSKDGALFELVSTNQSGALKIADCNGLFVDEDLTAYNIYSSEAADHHVSIEVLSSNYSTFAGENLGSFPVRYVEGPILFRRGGWLYASFGSCNCFARAGTGMLVYRARSVMGPWVRQPYDLNCNSTDENAVCGAYGDRQTGGLTIAAQGISFSYIPLANGSTVILWQGERWQTAPFNNPDCPDECQKPIGPCAPDPRYVKGHGLSYWIPLRFDPDGNVLPLEPFVNSFELDIAVAGDAA